MRKLGKIGVTLALSLILSVTIFASSAFAQKSNYDYRAAPAYRSGEIGILAPAHSARQNFSMQRFGTPQASDQQTNYQQNSQDGDTCNWFGDCQHAARCTHIFRSPWGWIFICRGW